LLPGTIFNVVHTLRCFIWMPYRRWASTLKLCLLQQHPVDAAIRRAKHQARCCLQLSNVLQNTKATAFTHYVAVLTICAAHAITLLASSCKTQHLLLLVKRPDQANMLQLQRVTCIIGCCRSRLQQRQATKHLAATVGARKSTQGRSLQKQQMQSFQHPTVIYNPTVTYNHTNNRTCTTQPTVSVQPGPNSDHIHQHTTPHSKAALYSERLA
jgi:hypothetical protein